MTYKLNIINISPKYSSIWKCGYSIFKAMKDNCELNVNFIDLWKKSVSSQNILRALQLLKGLDRIPDISGKNDLNLYTVPLLSKTMLKLPAKLNIIMFHDLWTLSHDGILLNFLCSYLYPKSLYADIIITNSETTKTEIYNKYHYMKIKNKIYPIHLGIDDAFFSGDPMNTSKKKVDHNSVTFLSIGRDEPRKNLRFLLKLLTKLKSNGINFHLLRVGNFSDENKNFIRSTSLSEYITIYTDISEKRLISLYTESDFLLFPSLYEGFGLPPIEAMACGCIPLTSKNGSLPEVVGNNNLLLDLDIEVWYDTLMNLINDKQLKSELVRFCLSHSRNFTWNRFASKLCKVILSHIN